METYVSLFSKRKLISYDTTTNFEPSYMFEKVNSNKWYQIHKNYGLTLSKWMNILRNEKVKSYTALSLNSWFLEDSNWLVWPFLNNLMKDKKDFDMEKCPLRFPFTFIFFSKINFVKVFQHTSKIIFGLASSFVSEVK